MSSEKHAKQITMPIGGCGRYEPLLSNERIAIGDKASDVFAEVLRLNPEITGFQICFYPFGDSDNEDTFVGRTLIELPEDLGKPEWLKRIAELNFESTFEEELGSRILAVTSKVATINNGVRFIPMVDFASVGKKEKLLPLILDVFKSRPGVVLDSGDSYHYWGFNLHDDIGFIEELKQMSAADSARIAKYENPLYCDGFIRASLKRGFSALRLFGYPNTNKEKEPEVVAII